jgi:hypothetical protein
MPLIPKTKSKKTKLLELLKELEWSGTKMKYSFDTNKDVLFRETSCCPSCKNFKSYGHNFGCKLNAAIK